MRSLKDISLSELVRGLQVRSTVSGEQGEVTEVAFWFNGGDEEGTVCLSVLWENGNESCAPIADFAEVFVSR